jgi:hypothetical protein
LALKQRQFRPDGLPKRVCGEFPRFALGEFFLSVMTAELRQESMLVKFINPELSPSNASVFAAAIF